MTYQPAYSRGGAWTERDQRQVLGPILDRTGVERVLHSPETLRAAVELVAARRSTTQPRTTQRH